MKIPFRPYQCPLGRTQPTAIDLDALKEQGWREQRILVVAVYDDRLDFTERELIRRLGERLYGHPGARHG